MQRSFDFFQREGQGARICGRHANLWGPEATWRAYMPFPTRLQLLACFETMVQTLLEDSKESKPLDKDKYSPDFSPWATNPVWEALPRAFGSVYLSCSDFFSASQLSGRLTRLLSTVLLQVHQVRGAEYTTFFTALPLASWLHGCNLSLFFIGGHVWLDQLSHQVFQLLMSFCLQMRSSGPELSSMCLLEEG